MTTHMADEPYGSSGSYGDPEPYGDPNPHGAAGWYGDQPTMALRPVPAQGFGPAHPSYAPPGGGCRRSASRRRLPRPRNRRPGATG